MSGKLEGKRSMETNTNRTGLINYCHFGSLDLKKQLCDAPSVMASGTTPISANVTPVHTSAAGARYADGRRQRRRRGTTVASSPLIVVGGVSDASGVDGYHDRKLWLAFLKNVKSSGTLFWNSRWNAAW